MPRWPKDEPVATPDIVDPEDKPNIVETVTEVPEPEKIEELPKESPKVEIPVKPEPQNSGEYWRSLTDDQKKAYIGLYSNPYVKVTYPDVVELAWSEYVKIPKGEQK